MEPEFLMFKLLLSPILILNDFIFAEAEPEVINMADIVEKNWISTSRSRCRTRRQSDFTGTSG